MSNPYPKLSFPPIRLRCKKRDDQTLVWDELRRKWLVLTPEEWVRRHAIAWLITNGIPPHRIAQEYPVNIEGQPQRADIVVVDDAAKPSILVECKATTVPLTDEVFEQARRYNSVLHAETVIITNGVELRIEN